MAIIKGTAGDDVALKGTAAADTISGPGGDDQLTGLAGADKMDGGALTGIEALVGSPKADVLTGDGGANTLFGLGGGDRGRDHQPVLEQRQRRRGDRRHLQRRTADRIDDFHHGQDRIGLSSIDADPSGAANDAFEFLGQDTLIDAPGQIGTRSAATSRSSR